MPTAHEQFSEQFRRWELRGRGWQVFGEPVFPEPPFVPFRRSYLPEPPAIDDGHRPTILSSFVQKLSRKMAPPPPPPVEPEPEEESEPTPLIRESLVELQASLPDKLDISKEAFEQFLLNLSLCREPIAFELMGSYKRVAAQFVADEGDTPLLRRQLQAYFPEAVFVPREGGFDCRFPTSFQHLGGPDEQRPAKRHSRFPRKRPARHHCRLAPVSH
jgi:hypothetical protein